MTDKQLQNEQQIEPDLDDVEVVNPNVKVNAGSWFTKFTFLLLCLLIIASCAAGWFVYAKFEAYQAQLLLIDQQQKETQKKLMAQDQLLSKLNTMQSSAKLDDTVKDEINNLNQQLAELRSKQLQQMQSSSLVDQQAWVIKEMEFLLSIANERLILAKDASTTISILQLVSERIKQLEDIGLQPLREALAIDIATLQSIEQPDRAGIVAELIALQSMIDELPILATNIILDDKAPVLDSVSADLAWHENLTLAFTELSTKWFEVREHQQSVKPMLSEQKLHSLQINLAIMIQIAELATIEKKQIMYAQALQQLDAWVRAYFDQEDSKVKLFLEQINILQQQKIDVSLPEQLESLTLIKRRLAQ